MTLVITRFPVSGTDDPMVWRIAEGQWQKGVVLSEFIPDAKDDTVMAVVSPDDARCIWSSLPDLESRQAEGVAKLRATEQSLGLVHAVARYVEQAIVVTATIAPALMQDGLSRLAARGLNPDTVIPFGLAIAGSSEHIAKADFDGLTVLCGERFAVPDEAVFRDLLVGEAKVEEMGANEVREMLLAASNRPLVNLREDLFAKREHKVWATANQRKWIVRLVGSVIAVTSLLALVTLAKYWSVTSTENGRALAAAQKIDLSIKDVAQAEAQLDRALQQKNLTQGRFMPLSSGLWRAVQIAPNVSVREMRFSNDGILTVVLAAPNAESINKALLVIQQDGYRVTAMPRQDKSGATLVDLTMRMP